MALDPTVRRALEQRGVDSVRALLTSNVGSGRGASVQLDTGVSASRGDVEDWLRERGRAEGRWVKIGTIAAIVGAVAAVVAAVFAYLAVPTSRGWHEWPTIPSPVAPPAVSPQPAPPNLLPGTKFQQR